MPILKKGDRGPEVRVLQDRLIELGFMTVLQQSTGPGVFGKQTESALRELQKSAGLAESGRLTPDTEAVLSGLAPAPVSAVINEVKTRLQSPGPGYVSYKAGVNGENQFGRASTIIAILGLGAAWVQLHPEVPFQVGHISRRGGVKFPPHKGHKTGLEMDVRPFRDDLALAPISYSSARYSQEVTLRFARLVKSTFPDAAIFFNDPTLVSLGLTKRVTGHDDHLHVRFAGPK